MKQIRYLFKLKILFIALLMSTLFLTGCSLDIFKQRGENVVSDEPHISYESKTLPKETLKLKDQGKLVLQVKKALQQIGYDININSDDYDGATYEAIKDFQAQVIELPANGIYNEATGKSLVEATKENLSISPGEGFDPEQISADPGKVIVVNNPNDFLVLANKNHTLPDGFEPDDLTAPNVRFPFTEDLPKRYIRKDAAKALEQLFKKAESDGHILYGQSGYRSYERQAEVFNGHTSRLGKKEAKRVSAVPGQSEHQTGLAMDVTAASVDFELTQAFGDTKEGQWLKENAHEFGFIIRYEKGKEEITGYDYEPWHLRYVDKEVAKVIKENDLTLEEYLGAYE